MARACAALVLAALCACTAVSTAPHSGERHGWTKPHVLRMANLSEPDSLNPVVGNQQIDVDLSMFWAGYLFNYNDRNEFVPELATIFPTLDNGGISKDERTITYHLRPGVLWHDGKPFGADDVIFTWHAIMNPNNNVGSRAGYDLIDRIDRRDDHTIAVHLKTPWAPFTATFFTMGATPYPVLPAHLLAQLGNINRVPYNSQPIGTGPFIVDRWQRGSAIVFRANPHYWRGPPKLQRIEYSPIPSDSTIATLVQSHQVDLEYLGAAALYPQYRAMRDVRVELVPFTEYGMIQFNVKSPALSDVRVRQALQYGTDLERLRNSIGHGVNVRAYTDQPQFLWAYNPSVTHYVFDPARAKALLDSAGWTSGSDGVRTKNGRRLQLVFTTTAGSANGNQISVFLQRAWRALGVDLEIKAYPSSLYLAPYNEGGIVMRGKFDVAIFSWINGTDPDDSTNWMCDQIPPRGQNNGSFCNHDLDAAERLALASSDQAVRKKAYGRIQTVLVDEVPAIFTTFARRLTVLNPDLRNYKPAHAVTTFWNTWEWDI